MDRILISDTNSGALYIRAMNDSDDVMRMADMLWQGVRDPDLANGSLGYWMSKLNYAYNDGKVAVLVKEVPTTPVPTPSVVGLAIAINNPQQNALELFGVTSYWDEATTVPLLLTALRDVAALNGRSLVKRVVRVSYEQV